MVGQLGLIATDRRELVEEPFQAVAGREVVDRVRFGAWVPAKTDVPLMISGSRRKI